MKISHLRAFLFVCTISLLLTACEVEPPPVAPPTTLPTTSVPQASTPTSAPVVNTPSAGKTPTSASATSTSSVPGFPPGVTPLTAPLGWGGQKSFWTVWFTAPTGSRDPASYVGGIDVPFEQMIDSTQTTLDIAAFEFNNEVLTQAILRAKARGVTVRVVTDNENGTQDTKDTSLARFVEAGIPVVDDGRSALMHNKFMIFDSQYVLTGSWNYTVNDTYRNNNNALLLRSQRAVDNYQTEFNEMFQDKKFGPRSPANTPFPVFAQNGIPLQIYFSPEDKVLTPLVTTLSGAQTSILSMNFSFTDYDAAQAILNRASAGISFQGIWETTGSETTSSELRTLYCAGLDARQDGNPFVLHHKVFIVDGTTVIMGSFNISSNATNSNDENLLIINDPDLAALYTLEFQKRWAESKVPTRLTCN
jgi:phosphatidylserine/phosphatidylglycerophosphate/cardiolipin synthase-like enzyme